MTDVWNGIPLERRKYVDLTFTETSVRLLTEDLISRFEIADSSFRNALASAENIKDLNLQLEFLERSEKMLAMLRDKYATANSTEL